MAFRVIRVKEPLIRLFFTTSESTNAPKDSPLNLAFWKELPKVIDFENIVDIPTFSRQESQVFDDDVCDTTPTKSRKISVENDSGGLSNAMSSCSTNDDNEFCDLTPDESLFPDVVDKPERVKKAALQRSKLRHAETDDESTPKPSTSE